MKTAARLTVEALLFLPLWAVGLAVVARDLWRRLVRADPPNLTR